MGDTVNFFLAAIGAARRFAGPAGLLPPMIAPTATENPCRFGDLVVSAFHADGFSMNQRIGDHLSGALDDTAESRPGNPHPLAGLFVGQTKQIGQADGLPLIHRQFDFVQCQHGYAAGLEIADMWVECDEAIFSWSNHHSPL